MDPLTERLKNMTPLQRAVFALKETQARLDALEQRLSEPIAIVGMACRFPGGASDPASFWDLLSSGVDAVTDVPPDRWNADEFYDPDPAAPGKMAAKTGGFLERIDEFDNHFFAISEREAVRIDPQHRMLLELTWEALEDAGLPPSKFRGGKVGVFVGIAVSEYGMTSFSDLAQTGAYTSLGSSLCMAANRLSFALGLQGPSIALDTACSSSLVATHLACQHIRSGECEAALVGACNLVLSPFGSINLAKAGLLAKDGRVRSFDAAASGYVRSDGAGMVLLKPLSAALANRDPIYAVIRGSAVNQNGTSNGLTAPSRAAQEQVLHAAYARAGVSPGQVQFVECQATGTPLGDTIEALALGTVLGEGRAPGDPCALGAVKTNLGHMEAASGIAGLMKAALALKHGQVPPNLHFQTPNADIPFGTLPLSVPCKLEPWPKASHPRVAGVNAFGYGGSNAHVVLEESPAAPDEAASPGASAPRLLPLSARTEKALRDLAQRYVEFLGNAPQAWNDVCHTAAARRDHHDLRLAVLADSHQRAAALLRNHLDGRTLAAVFSGRKPFGRDLKVAFLYGDRPEAWKAIVPRSRSDVPGFAEAAEEIDAECQRVLGWSLKDFDATNAREDDPACAKPLLLACQLALTAWWRRAGVVPHVVLGQGCGELAAAAAAGILTTEAALQLVARGHGTTSDRSAQAVAARPAVLPFLSSVDGKAHSGPDLNAGHWQTCLGSSPSASVALAALADRQVDVCLEIGLAAMMETCRPLAEQMDRLGVLVPSLLAAPDGSVDAWTAIGSLYAAGADIAWEGLALGGRCVRVPTYPWQRQRLWMLATARPASSRTEDSAADGPSQAQGVDRKLATTNDLRPRPDMAAPYVAPRTELEAAIAESWSALLRIEGVGIHDNFFELGGDSLQATLLLNRLEEKLGEAVPSHVLFRVQTIADLAEHLAVLRSQQGTVGGEPVPRAPRGQELATSFAQEALWIVDRLNPGSAVYNVPLALRLSGPLDADALKRSIDGVVARHESLRTRMEARDGKPVQVIGPFRPIEMPVVDLADLAPADREAQALARATAEARRPFRLDQWPLLRALLLRLSPAEHVLVLVMHHVICDDWSLSVLFSDMVALYEAYTAGRPSPLGDLDVQYADYALWQRQRLQGERLERLRDHWRQRLAGVALLELPTDRPRSPQASSAGETFDTRLPAALTAQLKELGRREGATLYMTLLAAFQVLLHRYSGQDDFAVGSPVANRLRPEIEPLIGYFINMVVLRADLAGDPTFRDLLGRVRRESLDAFEHQELPFEQIVDAVNPDRHAGRHPLFQVTFTLQNAPRPEVKLAGLSFSVVPLDTGTSKFELSCTAWEEDGGLVVSVEYDSSLFRADAVRRMTRQFQTLLEGIVADPARPLSRLPLLTEAERRQVLTEWNDTARDYPTGECVLEWFEQRVRENPRATALIDGARQWTYEELDSHANRLGHFLQARGVGPDRLVAVRLRRSAELIAAVLGALKAGGAYLPIDPDAPAERVRFTLEDARAEVLVTERSLLADLPAGLLNVVSLDEVADEIALCPAEQPARQTTAEHLAYVIYTSGSTGRPKGVMIEHRALMNYTQAAIEQYGITGEDRVLQFAAASFDAHVEEIFPCLSQGGTLVLRDDNMLDAKTFLDRCRQWQLTFVTVPTGFWHELTTAIAEEGLEVPDSLRLLVIGGEAALPERVATWHRCVGTRVRLLNTYGPTETTVVATAAELGPGDGQGHRVPIGRPLGNYRAYVLDAAREPVPVGVPGELFIGGESLARGYLNRPDLTEERFVADPFAAKAGARMYKTGDVVRWRADGRMEFIGRTDHQVKIRGFRIEPGEVEQVLREHPDLADAAVMARLRAPGDLQLVAYLVGRAGTSPSPAEVRQFLRGRLPEFMVPTACVSLDALPQTPGGKVDRRALPEPDWSGDGTASQGDFVAPRTPVEQQLAALWAELLNVDRVGASDDFFDLGGNSLLTLRLASRVRQAFGVDLPPIALFRARTLAELAEQIAALRASPRAPQTPPIQPVPRESALPASFAQEPFWFLQQLLPSSNELNSHATLWITGELDVAALGDTVQEIVRRHGSLRTQFALEPSGSLVQVIVPDLRVDLPVEDVRHVPQSDRAAHVAHIARQQAAAPFDLARAPLLRVRLLRTGDEEHALLLTIHHILCDGWSLDVLNDEVAQIYAARRAGRPSPLPELPVQYADYAAWQRDYLQGATLESLLDYWRTKLDGLAPLQLPTDRPRGAAAQYRQVGFDFRVPHRVKMRLDRLCSEQAVTPHMALLAAFQVLLHRYTDSDDVAVGSVSAGRQQPEVQGLIGLFINTLVMRTDLSGDPDFRSLLARVAQTAIDAYEHQEMRFELLAKELQPGHDLMKQPLVQVLFVFQQSSTARRAAALGDLSVRSEAGADAWEAAEDFDLTFSVEEEGQGFRCQFGYDANLFDVQTIARMAAHFQTLLEAIVADPGQRLSQLSMLSQQEREQVLVEWNQTRVEYGPPCCVHQLFERQVRQTPDSVALVFEGQTITYRELNARANRLAHYLAALGVGPEVPVGVCLEPSLELAVAVLGAMKAGGIYLPLDPEDPRQRLDFFVADSRPAVVLTKSCWLDRFSAPEARVVALDVEGEAFARESGEDLPCRATPDNGVCLLYTSGSTGQPKGVVNLHRGIANYLLAKEQMAGLGPDDRVLFTTPISFDTSVEEFFFGLTCGGCLVIERAGGQKRDMRHLVELIGRERVTTACFVPSTLRLLLEEEDLDGCRWLKRVFVGGEVLTRDLLERFFRRIGAELYNEYGPTEASIDVAVWNCRLDDSRRTIPIGQPIANVRLYILDEARNPVPIGIPGELYIGGVAVARGYLNRPELNAERFLSDPFSDDGGGTMYRTGDRCRWLPDGNIEFLGRRDGQVKIHGGRLELGEVEAAIGRHPSVAQAAVVVRRSSPDYQYLAAYVVPRGRHIDDEARTEFTKELRQFLRSAVPEYMVPQAFEVMESLPKLSSGKLNRAALPDATLAARQERRYVAPRTPVEKQLAAIWAEVLRVERVGAHDNFFDLGGHSLLAVRLISQLRNALEVELPVATLFASPTLDELAEQIEQLKASGRTLEATAIPRSPRDRPVPVSYSQAPFWVISRLHPEASLYAAHPTLRFRGPLDAAALEQAFNEVLRRHEALRTTFVEQGGEVVQVIAPHQARSVPVVDLSGLPAEAREAELLRHAKAESQRPIDLAEGPLMRLQLLRLGPDEHVVLVAMHHIVYDGWSLAVLSRELVTAYLAFTSGRPSPLPDLPIQYADFAAWQRARLDGEVLDKLRGYWLKQLEGLPALELAADHARPAVRTTRVGACEHRLPRQLNQALQQLGNEQGVTKFMALLAAFEVLLHRRSSQEDFAVSTPVAGRLRPETEGLIGCFINDLVLRANLAGDPSVRQLLARVRETVLQGFEHQEMPFMRLVEEFAPPRSPRRCTLVAAELIFHNEPVGAETVPGLELMDSQRPIETEGGDSDVSLEVYDLEEGPRLRLCYSADLFEPGTAASILEDFQAVLEAMIANPQQRVSELPGARFQAVPSPAAPSAPKPAPTYVAPRSAVEQDLAAIWARLLKREQVGIHDNFFEVGGNSLLAVLAAEHASTAFGIELPPSTLFLAPTVAALAERIEADGVGRSPVGSQAPADGERPAVFEPQSPRDGGQSLVSLRVGPALPQLFCCHGMGGHVAVFMPLARALAQGRPVYALQAQGLAPGQQPHDCVEAMADLYGREIRETQPRGPYLLAGWSLGGLIALETARRIRAAGDEVPLVAMLDTYLSQEDFATEELDDYSVLHWLAPYLKLSLDELKSLPLDQQWERIAERAKTAKGAGAADIRRLAAACQAHLAAFARYQPRPYDGRVVLFRAEDNRETDSRWDSFCTQVRVETVPGNHYSMLRKPHVQALADRLDRYLTCPDKTCCGAAVSAALPAGETPAPQAKAEPIQDRPSPGDAGRTP